MTLIDGKQALEAIIQGDRYFKDPTTEPVFAFKGGEISLWYGNDRGWVASHCKANEQSDEASKKVSGCRRKERTRRKWLRL